MSMDVYHVVLSLTHLLAGVAMGTVVFLLLHARSKIR